MSKKQERRDLVVVAMALVTQAEMMLRQVREIAQQEGMHMGVSDRLSIAITQAEHVSDLLQDLKLELQS